MPLDTSNDGIDLQRQYASDWAPSFSQSILDGWSRGFLQDRVMEGIRLNYAESFHQQTGSSVFQPVDPSNIIQTILNIGGPISNYTNLAINNYLFTATVVEWGSLPSGSSTLSIGTVVTSVVLGATEITISRSNVELGFGITETPGAPTSEAFAISARLVPTTDQTIPLDDCAATTFARGAANALESEALLVSNGLEPLVTSGGDLMVGGNDGLTYSDFFDPIITSGGSEPNVVMGNDGNVMVSAEDPTGGSAYARILLTADGKPLFGPELTLILGA